MCHEVGSSEEPHGDQSHPDLPELHATSLPIAELDSRAVRRAGAPSHGRKGAYSTRKARELPGTSGENAQVQNCSPERHNEASRSPEQMLDEVFAQDMEGSFHESGITLIAQLLEAAGHPSWSQMPRIYVILRMIGQLEAIKDFVSQELDDCQLPFEANCLPRSLSQSEQADFVQAQHIVLDPATLVYETRPTRPIEIENSSAPSASKTKPIFQAIRAKDLAQLNQLLAQKVDISIRDDNQWTPLHHCSCLEGHTDLLVRILDFGADIEATDAAGKTPLHVAVANGSEDATRMLLQYQANIEAMTPDHGTPLHIASLQDLPRIVQLLLDAGAQIEARVDHYTPLHIASQHGSTAAAAVLILNGAQLDAGGKHHWTPLHVACGYGQYNVAHLLLDSGADVNARDHAFWTPLHQGSRRDHVEIIALLLGYGAEINAEAAEHMTALQLTAYCGMEAAAEALVASGADTSTALAVALGEGRQGIVNIIRR